MAIGNGWTNTEIAERLVLSESTAKKRIGQVLSKIGARDRVRAVIVAFDTGLVKVGKSARRLPRPPSGAH